MTTRTLKLHPESLCSKGYNHYGTRYVKKMSTVTKVQVGPPTTPTKKEVKRNAWLDHVKAYRATHSELSYKEVLEKAKVTYTKKVVVKKEPGAPRKLNPWMEHIKKFIRGKPTWKETMTYKDVLLHCKTTYRQTSKNILK